jgi:NAD(P)-dependent dehydrogenase (short-subunit alcohol dehydrogenase family)
MPRTVLITGCSDGGLGAALAVAFHENGDRVFATARNPSKMTYMATQGIETFQLDVLSEDSIKACVEKVASATGGSLDILVNNAGAGYNMPLLDASIPDIQKQFELNVFAVLRTAQLFFPLLRNSTTKMLVNNTSVNSVMALPWQGPYNASKAAIASVTETLRLELQPFGIRVIDLKTGGVRSKFFENVSASATHMSIPEASAYVPGKEEVESRLTNGPEANFMESEVWARKVVHTLSKHNPPPQVWHGGGATTAWFATSFIPTGWLDSKLKKLTGLDIVERRIKQEAHGKST